MQNPQPPSNHKTVPTYIGIALLLVIIALASWLLTKDKPQPDDINLITTDTTESKQPVLSFVGVVKSINAADGKFELYIPAKRNGLKSDKIVTVEYSQQTSFSSLTIPQTIPADLTEAARQELFKRQLIEAQDLQVGDDITVVSATDIRTAAVIPATRVQVRNIK